MIVELPRNAAAPSMARAAVERCNGLSSTAMARAKLLVSELVTNSVKYGSNGSVRVQITHPEGEALYVEVTDHGSGFIPRARDRSATEVGGWGLPLVESLADRWGFGKGASLVWFELSATA